MKLRNSTLVTLLFLSFGTSAQTVPRGPVSSAQEVSAKSLSAALEDYFQKAAGLGFSGAVLVAKDGDVLLRKGYGWADVKRRIPIRADTVFDIGSGVFIEALRNNDNNALKLILPEDSSPEDAARRWNDFVKQNGELDSFEVIGTSPLNQSGVQTFVRLKFKKTDGVYKVTWRDQKLHEQEEDRLQPAITAFLRKSFVAFPLSVHFLPQSETDFATYDLFKGRTINITFRQDKLVVHTKNGDVVAQKAKKGE